MLKILILFLTLSVCMIPNIDSSELDVFKISGMNGATKCILFVSLNEGYSFNEVMIHDDWTDEQLDDPNFVLKSSYNCLIYKTLDGGRSWRKVLTIENTRFGSSARHDKNSIYIPIYKGLGRKNDQILKYDFEEQQYQLLDFLFNGLGDLWLDDENIFLQNRKLYKISKDFKHIDSSRLDNIIIYEPVKSGNNFYALVWGNEILNLNKMDKTKFEGVAGECITKIDESNLIIAGEQAEGGITLFNFDVNTMQTKVLTSFRMYSIVRYLKSNDYVICGFIGNIEGMFTSYDLFYSLDKGKTWHIKKLQDSNSIHQNSLIENVLFILSGNKVQRIQFQ